MSGGALWQLLIFAALFAFAEGVSGVSWSLIGDYFGRKSFATLRGGVTTVHSILSMGVPVFAGWVYDTSGSYYWAIIPIIVLYLMAAAMFWNLPRARLPRRETDPTTEESLAGPEFVVS